MDNIGDIISGLSPQDIDMLKGVASSILGNKGDNANNQNTNQNSNVNNANQSNNNQNQSNGIFNNIVQSPNVSQKVQDVASTINNASNVGNMLSSLENLNINKGDFDMMMKAKSIFDKMNNTKNKNVDLIMALKPHLSAETQNKAEQAMKILRLFEVLPLLKDLF